MITKVDRRNELCDYVTKDALLEPHHSHFVLVDTGDLTRFGGEIDFRGALQQAVQSYGGNSSREKVPLVLLVVGGGPNTYLTCLKTVEARSPCIFIKVMHRFVFFFFGEYS
jgi:transient receptor potential cation channel subfamily M protein 2